MEEAGLSPHMDVSLACRTLSCCDRLLIRVGSSIVIGMTASSDPSVKSWFGSSLVQSNYFFGVAKWSSIKSTSRQVCERTSYARDWKLSNSHMA
jgi:hypothetical protein